MKRLFGAFTALQEQLAARSPVYNLVYCTMKTYGQGLKLLAQETRRTLRESPDTFEKRVRRRIVKRDLVFGVPCTAYFLLPFVGNTLPVVAYYVPLILPTLWRSPRQRAAEMQRFQNRKLRLLGAERSLTADDALFLQAAGFRAPLLRFVPRPIRARVGRRYERNVRWENHTLDRTTIASLSTRQLQEALYYRAEFCLPFGTPVDDVPLYLPNNGVEQPVGHPDRGQLEQRLLAHLVHVKN